MPVDIFFAAEIDYNISKIDLHTATNIRDALEQLERELFFQTQIGAPYVRVVHGIGEGKLGKAVHEVLKTHPLVKTWKESVEGGNCIVIL